VLVQVCKNASLSSPKVFRCIIVFFMCREVQKRICVAGEDLTFVEAPTEPKWSSKGVLHPAYSSLVFKLIPYMFPHD
jgi:hypothetical protein